VKLEGGRWLFTLVIVDLRFQFNPLQWLFIHSYANREDVSALSFLASASILRVLQVQLCLALDFTIFWTSNIKYIPTWYLHDTPNNNESMKMECRNLISYTNIKLCSPKEIFYIGPSMLTNLYIHLLWCMCVLWWDGPDSLALARRVCSIRGNKTSHYSLFLSLILFNH